MRKPQKARRLKIDVSKSKRQEMVMVKSRAPQATTVATPKSRRPQATTVATLLKGRAPHGATVLVTVSNIPL